MDSSGAHIPRNPDRCVSEKTSVFMVGPKESLLQPSFLLPTGQAQEGESDLESRKSGDEASQKKRFSPLDRIREWSLI